MKMTNRMRLVKELDTVFSSVVMKQTKANYGLKCQFCKVKKISCCFHFVTRKKYSVRWDLDNAIGSCYGCNYLMEFDPSSFILWYIDNIGLEAYRSLVNRSKEKAKISDISLEAMINNYKEMVK